MGKKSVKKDKLPMRVTDRWDNQPILKVKPKTRVWKTKGVSK